jgi:hypothetical protein
MEQEDLEFTVSFSYLSSKPESIWQQIDYSAFTHKVCIHEYPRNLDLKEIIIKL